MNVIHPVNNIVLPPNKRESAMFVKKGAGLYPITHKFIVRTDTGEWLDKFQGSILECYNTLPWRSDSYFVDGRIWGTRYYKFICAYRNFAKYTWILEDPPNEPFEWTEGDAFGICDQLVNIEGENSGNGATWEEEWAEMGGYGIMVSGYGEGWVQGSKVQPITKVGVNSPGVIAMETSGYAPGRDNGAVLGFMWDLSIGECLPVEVREKDMAFWLYLVDIHGGMAGSEWDMEGNILDPRPANNLYIDPGAYYDPNNPYSQIIWDDGLFSAGEEGRRMISNQFKRAPWERYPHI
ncbi:MAG: hypothetical protein LBS84_05840 [Clostridiales bacterium]|jgi:hypothetical protein|nr:hypothetical protein [Clostridiales bacterium]